MAGGRSLAKHSLALLVFSGCVAARPSWAAGNGIPPSDVLPPTRLDQAPIPYPDGVQEDTVVVLELEIEKDGTVGSVVVKEGAPRFDEAARVAARSWRFSPAKQSGLPVRARILAKVAFHRPAPPPPPAPPVSSGPPTGVLSEKPSPAGGATRLPEAVEVSVVGEAREEPGSTHIPRSETRLVPGAFADPFRVVEVLPGVAPILSGIPYFTIRGAPPGNVGYSIDGIRVPLLFHVGAGPSVIAPGLVDRVDLFPSVYPARFGRYAGGIVAGETTKPTTVAHGEAQARIFDAGGLVEQPFANGKGSILLGGRYGYTGALLSIVAPAYALSYWDYQARLAYRVAPHDLVSAFSFGAYDFLRNKKIARTLFDVQFHRLDLRWDHDTESGHLRVAATLGSDSTLNAQEQASDLGTSTRSRGARLRFESDQRISATTRWRVGGDIGLEHFTSDNEVLGNDFVPFGPHTDRYGGAWIDFIVRPASGVEIVPAMRFDLLDVRNQTALAPEPRLATRVRIAEGMAWISALGLVHQAPTFLVPVPGTNLSIFETSNQEVWQASEAIEVALSSRILAKATAFRSVGFLTDVEGRSNNYGLELFLHRDFTQRLGGFISYTLSRAERSQANVDTWSTFDRPHVLSTVLGYDLGAGFRVGSRLFLESGRPYTVACPNLSCGPVRPIPSGITYTVRGRFPAFTRLDVRVEKKWTFASGATLAATFEWFNALVAREDDSVSWTPGGLVFSGRSPLTLPSVGVEVSY